MCDTIKKECFEFINRTVAADEGKLYELNKKIDTEAVKKIPSSVTDLNKVA